MTANQSPWPREWLMTDERLGDRLWQTIEALPPGSGVVFRHYATGKAERASLAVRVAEACRRRGLMLAIARDVELAVKASADLVHNPAILPASMPFSRSAHSFEEARLGWEAGASLIFLSPIFPTRSHPGSLPRSCDEASRVIAASPVPVIALGGVSSERFATLDSGFYGWAAIDAWLGAGPSRD